MSLPPWSWGPPAVVLWPTNSMYRDRENEGPIWMGRLGSWANWVSPNVRKVLAWRNLDGDIPWGTEVDKLAPDAVMASWSRGMSRSILSKRLWISAMMRTSSVLCLSADRSLLPVRRDPSSAEAAHSSRLARAKMSPWRALASYTALSSNTLPRPDLVGEVSCQATNSQMAGPGRESRERPFSQRPIGS